MTALAFQIDSALVWSLCGSFVVTGGGGNIHLVLQVANRARRTHSDDNSIVFIGIDICAYHTTRSRACVESLQSLGRDNNMQIYPQFRYRVPPCACAMHVYVYVRVHVPS